MPQAASQSVHVASLRVGMGEEEQQSLKKAERRNERPLSSAPMIDRDSVPEPATLRIPKPRPSEANTLRMAAVGGHTGTVAERLPQALDDEETHAERYRTVAPIARGGMGEIVRALDTQIGREVAIKRLPPMTGSRSEEWRQRFLREARVQALLEHPSVVPVYDLGFGAGGQPYFSMKRVLGETLHEVVERSSPEDLRRSRNRLLRAFVTVCLALHFAHEHGVVHRDLKPDNVMIGPHGEVYVLDWGVAKILEITRTGAATAIPLPGDETLPGEAVGTPGYMSPEQALGLGDDVDGRSDVFSLGAILFELLTGQHFFEGAHPQQLLAQTIDPDRRKRAPRADVPPELQAVIDRATSYDHAVRHQSALALAQDVERYLDGDRDEEHRARLVKAAVAEARRLSDVALDGPVADRDAARSAAMREAGRALSLAPDNEPAQAVILRLLATPPETLPKEAEQELDDLLARQRKSAMRDNAIRVAGWSILYPFLLLMTPQVPSVVAALGALNVLCLAVAVAVARTSRVAPAHVLGFAIVVTMLAATLTSIFGPLVFVPGFAGANAVVLGSLAPTRHRWLIYGLACASFAVPLGLELAGLLPRSMTFDASGITLVPRLVEFREDVVLVALLATSVVGVVMPARVSVRFRDALIAAETKLLVQKWQLAQLAPAKVRPAAS